MDDVCVCVCGTKTTRNRQNVERCIHLPTQYCSHQIEILATLAKELTFLSGIAIAKDSPRERVWRINSQVSAFPIQKTLQ